jgi:hypothetical protein
MSRTLNSLFNSIFIVLNPLLWLCKWWPDCRTSWTGFHLCPKRARSNPNTVSSYSKHSRQLWTLLLQYRKICWKTLIQKSLLKIIQPLSIFFYSTSIFSFLETYSSVISFSFRNWSYSSAFSCQEFSIWMISLKSSSIVTISSLYLEIKFL